MKTLISIVTVAAASFSMLTMSAPTHSQVPQPDPLNQMRAEHMMISTDDFDGTIAWYSDILGFEITHQWTVPELPGIDLAYMERNGFVIEVVETSTKTPRPSKPRNLSDSLTKRGFGHLAFLVGNVDAVAAELHRRDVEFLLEPTSFPDSGRRLIFIFDNNGNLLEFLTPLSAYKSEAAQ